MKCWITALAIFMAVFATTCSAESLVNFDLKVSGPEVWKDSGAFIDCTNPDSQDSMYSTPLSPGNEYVFYIDKDINGRIWCSIKTMEDRVLFNEIINVSQIANGGRYGMNYVLPESRSVPDVRTTGFQEADIMLKAMQESMDGMSDVVLLALGNERINIYTADLKMHMITKRNQVLSLGYGELPDQSLNIYVDAADLDKLTGISLPDALRKGEIRFEGVGILNWIRYGMFRLFLEASFFIESMQQR